MTNQDSPRTILHLGLGAFHRAHQAWFTERMNQQLHDRGESPWTIVAFTGRSSAVADALTAQSNRYTLISRDEFGDYPELITSIGETRSGADAERWRELMSIVPVVTVTVTEAAYRASVDEDIRSLQGAGFPVTALGRLVDGLRARMQGGGGPLAIVACDNLNSNGLALSDGVVETAALVDERLASWIRANVSFVSTVVDRITPAPVPGDVATIDGAVDRCVVVTEVPSTWVLSGHFPAGRPPWELAGAMFVDELEPYERRKLWLLNGAHTLLASLGQLRGLTTVSDAVADPVCSTALEQLWDDAGEVLPFTSTELEIERDLLRRRFRNPGVRHRLDQIAQDAELKLSVRVLPVIAARLLAGLTPGDGELTAIVAWARLKGELLNAAFERLAPDLALVPEVQSRLAEIDRHLTTKGEFQ